MDGLLIVDKPAGPTSHDVVDIIRRLTGVKRVGHAGTLDPPATGVLVVLLGKATKLSKSFLNDDKSYAGTFRFGISTDTLDADGLIINESDATGLELKDIEKAAEALKGQVEQIPPMVSAIKVNGQPLYKAARQGQKIEIPPRLILIKGFKITGWRPGQIAEADFEIMCSKGTYIRSIARDLGLAVGTGAILSKLIRTRSGRFDISDAVRMEELKKDGPAAVKRHLIPIDAL